MEKWDFMTERDLCALWWLYPERLGRILLCENFGEDDTFPIFVVHFSQDRNSSFSLLFSCDDCFSPNMTGDYHVFDLSHV